MAARANLSSLKDVMNTLVTLALSSGVADSSSVFQALDPHGIPSDLPTDAGRLVTVSLLNLPWQYGDTQSGGSGSISNDTSALFVQADLKVTLWLRMQTDMFGRVKKAFGAVSADTTGTQQQRPLGLVVDSDPDGQGYLVKLMAVLFDADPIGPAGTLILSEPLQYRDIMFPSEPGAKIGGWFPFSLMFKCCFNWDLGLTLAAG